MPVKLAPSLDGSNCVCNRAASDPRCVASFAVSEDPAAEFLRVSDWLSSLRRTVVLTATDEYAHATYRSRLLSDCRTQLGLDHLELRLCTEHAMIHIRSTSQYGFYDFGANRKRIEKLCRQLQSE